MTSLSPEGVRFELLGDNIALVTLDRPDKRNAINAAMAQALDRIVKHCEADPAVRVVVIAGAGPVFCAGADLGEVARGNAAALRTVDGGFAGLTLASRTKPWIAAVKGPALAGGAEIALACDMIVAGKAASFGLPEVTRGLIASAGGTFRLPRALPRNIAIEMIVTGTPINAERAHDLGLVNRLVAPEDVVTTALGIAALIAANAPRAVIESLAMARAVHGDEAQLRAMASGAAARILATDDYREGARAFIDKRPPVWTGT